MGRQKTVAILGGGVGGMSAAHELVERGFRVTVYEARQTQGGKARSIFVPQTGTAGRRDLPGEHGFRFFPSFYRHLPDTMKRIPFAGNANGVFDNLVGTDRTRVMRSGEASSFEMLSHFPLSLEELRTGNPIRWYSQMGIPAEDTREFLRRALLFLTSCHERRLAEYENITYWDFLDCDKRHPNFQLFYGEIAVQALVAMKPRLASARTIITIGSQLWLDHLKPGVRVARVLNGPTQDVWLDPWFQHLRQRGVDYRFGAEVASLTCDAKRISGATLVSGETIDADYYVCAMPAERMAPLVDARVAAADPALANIAKLNGSWMTGAQFFLRRDVPFTPGHVIFVDAPWALTGVSHAQFWAKDSLRAFGDGTAKGVFSLCISDWDARGTYVKKPARECSLEEIRHEVWSQVKEHAARAGVATLHDEDLVHFHLADSIEHRADGTVVNREPLLVNTVGSWWNRPEAKTRLSNLFLASDYVRTHTDIATMEGANEAARRAVNGILEDSESRETPCGVWPLEEPDVFAPQRKLDELCFRRGLPHAMTRVFGAAPAAPVRGTEVDVDVLIVGAGPAGTSTALNLVRAAPSWAERILVLDRAIMPRDKLCGGAVTHLGEKILRRMGLSFEPPHMAVREARVRYAGKDCTFRGDPVLRIARRDVFDHWFVKKAEAAGVVVRQGESVVGLTQRADHVEVRTDRGVIRARVVVAADGSKSTIRKLLGIRDASHLARVLEVLTPEPKPAEAFRDGVAVFEFGRVSKGLAGYYWDFPSLIDGKQVMSRGVFDGLARRGSDGNALVKSLSSSLADRGHSLSELELKGHPIRTFNPNGPLSVGRVLLAGDAAGVDPLYGEGISFALGYGEVAASTIDNAFTRGRFDFDREYRRSVRRHPLLGQLPYRAHAARLWQYAKHPRAMSALWAVGSSALERTPWHNGKYVPANEEHWLLRA